MPKCRNCKKTIKSEDAILLLSNQYVCSEECKKQYKKTEEFHKAEFLDYLWTICGKQGNFIQLTKQSEWYHKKYNYKYSGMLYAAKYWTQVEENVWQHKWGIGQIFPSAYDRAKQFYEKQQALKRKFVPIPTTTKTISVSDIRKKPNRFNINIEEL